MAHQPSNITQLLRLLYPESPRFVGEEFAMTSTMIERATEYTVVPALQDDATVVTVDVVADLGNARTVILVYNPQTSKITEKIMPSARTLRGASSRRLFADRQLAPQSWTSLKDDEHILEIDGIEIFVGRLAVESVLPVSGGRGSDKRYSDGTTLELLLAGVCSALPKARQINARLITMVPIDLHDQIAYHVAEQFRRTHTPRYNGRDVTIRFTEVLVRRECEIAYRAIKASGARRVIGIDGGGRTVNIALFKEGQYVDGGTIDNLGVERALDDLDEVLLGRGHRPLTIEERLGLQTAMKAGQPFYIVANGTRVRVDDLARGPMDHTARAVIREVSTIAPIDAADLVFGIGGAAYPCFFGEVWQREININLVDDPELQNAYGALTELVDSPVKRPRTRK